MNYSKAFSSPASFTTKRVGLKSNNHWRPYIRIPNNRFGRLWCRFT
ncbi:hypothetical protein J2855_005230 [Agrobacterium tumefaciens]|nr:hypothetical protein [Agrobacterium tumefaciens]MBP2520464.1 hypothetical protein [Agrobacterium tumefaciens]MBP2579133.1 hypothetical protein [Agrobacterium tumefaciens]MBP2597426.1 hypothetical protein [Agrobacterium tumefaciens]